MNFTAVGTTNKTLQVLANVYLATCDSKVQPVTCIRWADFSPFKIRTMIMKKKLFSFLCDITGVSESRAHAVESKTRASMVDYEETVMLQTQKKPTEPFPQDAPLPKSMLYILLSSCVKIKPWGLSDQKLQWSVSPLDALPRVCGVIRNSRWPVKNSRSLSTSTTTWETCLPGLLGSSSAH